MDMGKIHQIGKSPNEIGNSPTLESLVAALEAVDRAFAVLGANGVNDDAVHEPLNERRWTICELIDATPARSGDELRAKIRALQIALVFDPDVECHGPGSVRELMRSIANDSEAIEALETKEMEERVEALLSASA